MTRTESASAGWTGRWRNQYGSMLTITDEAGGRLRGSFRTALEDSAFAGSEVEVTGIHVGACAHFAFARTDPDAIASFTGLLREGRLEAMWHVVTDRAVKPPRPGAPAEPFTLPWPHAVLTNADTFTRCLETPPSPVA
ncbi:avidin/streptavidin family protein [Actinocatenispora rupis]|nr:avidin/streptavidin family protein [Actinocatenispora rupis]